jgi:hypothetical protein
MANKKISELQTRTPSLSDLILVGDPSNGFSYKCTVSALATIIETDISDGYVTLGTTQTISGAKTFSNNLTLTSVANASTDTDKFLVLNGSNVVNYRTGSEVLSDIGGQGTITLTTTGTSGAATLVGNTLNIPNYAPDLSGYVPTSRTITINGTTQDLTANRTYNVGTVTSVAASGGTGISISGSPITSSGTITITNTAPDQIVALTAGTGISISGTYPNFTITNSSPSLGGTVTSVAMSVPTGFAISGSPITSSGTLGLTFASGYSLPTTASQTNWDTAYTNRITSLTTSGSSGAATLISNTLNIPNYTLAGLGGISLTSLSAFVPLSYNNTTGQFSIDKATTSADGYLSATDWNTFNNKQATITLTTSGTSGAATFTSNTLNIPQYQGALTLTTTGSSGAATLVGNTLNIPQYSGGGGSVSGTTNYIAKFTSSTAVGDSQLFDDGTNVGVGTATAGSKLQINGNAAIGYSTSTAATSNGLAVAGRVGIGTNTPSGGLQISLTDVYNYFSSNSQAATLTNVQGLAIGWNRSNGGGETILVYNRGAGSTGGLAFSNNDGGTYNERMRLTSGGNVGIGVVPSAWGSNYKVLESGNGSNGIGGALAFFNTGTNGAILYSNAYNNNTNDIYSYTAAAAKFSIENNVYKWFQAAQGTAGNNITFTQAMTLDASGNLNVGTTTSASKVNVSNKLRLWDTTPTGASTSNVMGYMFNTSGVPAGTFIEDVGTGIILSMGVNSAQSGSRTTSVVGGLFRMDTRSTQQEFTVIGVPTGGSTESQRIGVNLQNGNTILAPVAGNVGIGISAYATMGSKFQVNGNAAIGYSASTAAPTNGLMVAGNVGVNVTPSAWASGFRAIQIGGRTALFNSDINITTLGNNIFYDGVSYKYITSAAGSSIDLGGNYMTFGTLASGTAGANATGVERARIHTDGIFYIGNGDAVASPNTGIISATGGSGTNIAGAEFRIRGGASTGSGAGGAITFYTAAAGASGTTVRAATEVGRFTSAGDFAIGATSANSKLHVAGSLRLPITTKTTTYTLDATDYTVVFNLNGNATANLPDATTISGRIYVIKINRTNVGDTLTIDPNGAQTIDGAATLAIQCQYAVTIQSDGTNWRIIGDYAQGLNCL